MTKRTRFAWLPVNIYKSSSNGRGIVHSRFKWMCKVTETYVDHFNQWIALERDND